MTRWTARRLRLASRPSTLPAAPRATARAVVLRLAVIALALALVLPACGKKGPPLAPLVKVPKAADSVLGRRVGSTVYLSYRIPGANTDNTTPADIERLDVYGYTGSPSGNDDIVKNGMLVASIPVRKPPEEEEESRSKKDGRKGGRSEAPKKAPAETPAPPPRPPASMENGFDQGDTIIVTEPLGPEQVAPVVPKKTKKVRQLPEPPLDVTPPLAPPASAALPSRLYVAVGVNHKGQKGAFSGRVNVPLVAPSSAPSAPTVTYGENGFTLAWTAPADLRLPIQEPATDDLLKSTTIGMRSSPGAFNVYEVPPPRSGAGAAAAVTEGMAVPTPPAAGGQMPKPLNDKPLPSPSFVDKRIEFGKPRCYAVRTVSQVGALIVESDPSPAACVTPVDTFAPAAPKSLAAVASEGSISLIWDANTESDLAGYLVLRGEAGGELTPITPAPIKETTFRDTTVAKGVRYVYAIVAVDTSKNRSELSARVEETAR